MKYVGLLSGGKDSCFNLVHCHHNGHELVAAASLGPSHGKEEIDSYLYQTVGQDAIEFVAQALDVPLYRRTIVGTAIEQGSEYGTRIGKSSGGDGGGVQGDETEDLYDLLSTVKAQHPDVQGVSVGAILSNYQRVRVEHVCRRLGLTALTYLWQRDQAELLSEMINSGMHAILIKVAGIGLVPKHLGKTLVEMQPMFAKLNEMYGSHICGEGGEYESLTLDCPLFKKRITVVATEIVTHSDNAFATVAYLRIKNAILESKPDAVGFTVTIPPLLEQDFFAIQNAVAESSCDGSPPIAIEKSVMRPLKRPAKLSGPWIAIADICAQVEPRTTEASFEDEVEQCFRILQDRLAEYSLNLSHCANINIFLSSIDLFVRLNVVYAKFFGTSPPARACVAIDLPSPIRVKLDCIAYVETNPHERKALHVQGLSYWAPANIGPYSQAIHVAERVFVSGQIGLIPCSLSLPVPTSLATEAALASQHVERVTEAVKGTLGAWEGYTQLALYWLVDPDDAVRVRRACEKYTREDTTPTLFVGVPALPKGALVEKQVLVHTGRCLVQDDDDEMVFESRTPEFERGYMRDDDHIIYYEISKFKDSGDACAVICVRGQDDDRSLLTGVQKDIITPSITDLLSRIFSVRLFYLVSRQSSAFTFCDSIFDGAQYPPITSLPSRFILTKMCDSWDYALCITAR